MPDSPFKPNGPNPAWTSTTARDIDANFDDIYRWLRTLWARPESGVFEDIVHDLGSATSGHFDIDGLEDLTPDANVSIWQSAQPVPSKGGARDEFEMDAVVATGYVVDARTIRVYWFSTSGNLIVGDVAFAYYVGQS